MIKESFYHIFVNLWSISKISWIKSRGNDNWRIMKHKQVLLRMHLPKFRLGVVLFLLMNYFRNLGQVTRSIVVQSFSEDRFLLFLFINLFLSLHRRRYRPFLCNRRLRQSFSDFFMQIFSLMVIIILILLIHHTEWNVWSYLQIQIMVMNIRIQSLLWYQWLGSVWLLLMNQTLLSPI